MDRRGESEESGDDETRRKSINGDVDPNQPTATSRSSSPPTQPQRMCFILQIRHAACVIFSQILS